MVRTTGSNPDNNGNGNGGSPSSRRHQQQASSSKHQPGPTPASPVRALVRIIPEMFNDYNQIGYKQALNELDAAFDERCPVIVVEPMNLGDQTSRWIRIGNGLHKTAIVCGSVSSIGLYIGDPWPNGAARGIWYCICGTLATATLAAHALHVLSWQSDPCSNYQVETDPRTLAQLLAGANYCTGGNGHQITSSSSGIQSASVVVLLRKDVRGRNLLQNSIATVTGVAILYRVYKWLF